MTTKQYAIPDAVYTALKWLTLVGIPAATTLYVALAGVWGWPCASEVAKTSAAVCTCLGTVLGVSAATATEATLPDDSGIQAPQAATEGTATTDATTETAQDRETPRGGADA